ncbi:hypothetical protein AAMO2058_001706900, partial [Amorphochlora amoebiformis]
MLGRAAAQLQVSPSIGSTKSLDVKRVCGNKYCQTRSTIRWSRVIHRGKPEWLCNGCGIALSQEKFCPHCEQVYRQSNKNGFDGKEWISCVNCTRWSHVECEARNWSLQITDIYEQTKKSLDVMYLCAECRLLSEEIEMESKGKTVQTSTPVHVTPRNPSAQPVPISQNLAEAGATPRNGQLEPMNISINVENPGIDRGVTVAVHNGRFQGQQHVTVREIGNQVVNGGTPLMGQIQTINPSQKKIDMNMQNVQQINSQARRSLQTMSQGEQKFSFYQ